MDRDQRYAAGFGSFDGRVWLNCAHQGPLPKASVEAIARGVRWKTAPHRMADRKFADAPDRFV